MRPSLLMKSKSGLRAAFLLLGLCQSLHASAATAPLEELAQKSQWQALLHVRHGQPQVNDAGFLLTAGHFSLEGELKATTELLQRDKAALCRFPGRAQWLAQQGVDIDIAALDACPEVAEFRHYVPIEKVDLVFASESITTPASMLGHTFLRLSGKDTDGLWQEHAISFYTDSDTLNFPKLLFDSLVVGKRGFFALTPYTPIARRYLSEEQRSLWHFSVRFSPEQRELFRLHLLELKHAKLTYFFQDYNCATLLHFVLSLGDRPLPETPGWMTPKDVVRQLSMAGMIGSATVEMPSRTMTRQLASSASVDEVAKRLSSGQILSWQPRAGDPDAFLQASFASTYNQYLHEKGLLDKETFQANDRHLSTLLARFPGQDLASSDALNPLRSPQESQVVLMATRQGNATGMDVTLRPASHTLDDDNRSYANESALELLTATVHLPLQHDKARLERFTLYGMKSLLPRDALTGGWSGRFSVRYDRLPVAGLATPHHAIVDGAAGLAWRATRDIDLYALAGLGLASRPGSTYLYPEVEGGLVLRAIFDSKLRLGLGAVHNTAHNGRTTLTQSLAFSKYLTPGITLRVAVERLRQDARQQTRASLGVAALY